MCAQTQLDFNSFCFAFKVKNGFSVPRACSQFLVPEGAVIKEIFSTSSGVQGEVGSSLLSDT